MHAKSITKGPTRTHIFHYASVASKLRRTQGLRDWNGASQSEGHLGRIASTTASWLSRCAGLDRFSGIGRTLVRTEEAVEMQWLIAKAKGPG